ncbi:hypothetical protein TcWFU_008193 [Taenia crassiceps]|uniref:Uncharacterized protein n=1 Tax=Taenia crassiceps TaxID=6207 RepID=A0ABR4QI68_9CEST
MKRGEELGQNMRKQTQIYPQIVPCLTLESIPGIRKVAQRRKVVCMDRSKMEKYAKMEKVKVHYLTKTPTLPCAEIRLDFAALLPKTRFPSMLL